jgi:murein DD-endopeptidase MepM/ murein hydrolase activator NlpD
VLAAEGSARGGVVNDATDRGVSARPLRARCRHRQGRRFTGVAIAGLCLLGTTFAVVSSSPGTARASIGSDRSKVAELEQLIARDGRLIQALVGQQDQIEARMVVIKNQIGADRKSLAADRRSQAAATLRLRSLAIDTYVGSSSTWGSFVSSTNVSTAAEQQVYLGVASGNMAAAVATLKLDRHRTSVAESVLDSEETILGVTLGHLTSARLKAEAAIANDEAILGHVRGNLLSLVIAANERREAADEREEEEREAEKQAQEAAKSPKPAPPPVRRTTAGSYANPLASISSLTPERVDQGVDYSGYGPIYAIGDGVVLSTVNAGWPGGTFITYQLSSGAASGLVVYAAEDIDPAVSVGQHVTASTVLGQMYEGPDGIETGWADGSALGETMAAEYGQFNGSNSTAFGYNFSQLLESTGAPGGILQNSPPTGSLPSGWPQW